MWCTRVHHRMRVHTPSHLLTERIFADAETYQPLVGATGERTRLRIAGTTQTLSLALHFSRRTKKLEHLFSSVSRMTLLSNVLVFFWGGAASFRPTGSSTFPFRNLDNQSIYHSRRERERHRSRSPCIYYSPRDSAVALPRTQRYLT